MTKCFANNVKLIKPLKGEFNLQSDPMILQIVLAIASQMVGSMHISVLHPNKDVLWFIQILQKLGIDIDTNYKSEIIVNGNGIGGLSEPFNVVNCNNSKVVFYLLCGMFASYSFFSSVTLNDVFFNVNRFCAIETLLSKAGVNVNANKLPISIIGNKYAMPMIYELNEQSFYLKTMLLMLALNVNGNSIITEPLFGSYDHSENLLRYFGFSVSVVQNEFSKSVIITGKEEVYTKDIAIASKVDSVNYLAAGATMVYGSDIIVKNVCVNPARIKMLELLIKMGANIEFLNVHEKYGEKIADLSVKNASLNGIVIDERDFMLHDYPLILIIASYANGDTIIGKKQLFSKFANFVIKMVVSYLRQAGVDIIIEDDQIIVKGTNNNIEGGISVNCFDNDSVALAFMVCGFIANSTISIYNYESHLFKTFNNGNY